MSQISSASTEYNTYPVYNPENNAYDEYIIIHGGPTNHNLDSTIFGVKNDTSIIFRSGRYTPNSRDLKKFPNGTEFLIFTLRADITGLGILDTKEHRDILSS